MTTMFDCGGIMSRESHQERARAVASLGKELAKRARSRCELCDQTSEDLLGEKLRPFELTPLQAEPSLDWLLLLCPTCQALSEQLPADTSALYFLKETCWSETQPIQLFSLRVLRSLAKSGLHWAVETLENCYVDEAIDSLVSPN